MRRMRKIPTLGLTAALIASPVHADEETVKRAADSLIKAFIGYCVQVMPNVDRIETSAKPLGWKEIDTTDAAVAMLAPPSPTAKWKAWLVEKGADVPFFLAISSDTAKGKSASVLCSGQSICARRASACGSNQNALFGPAIGNRN
jgi:hypothetical protein